MGGRDRLVEKGQRSIDYDTDAGVKRMCVEILLLAVSVLIQRMGGPMYEIVPSMYRIRMGAVQHNNAIGVGDGGGAEVGVHDWLLAAFRGFSAPPAE